MTELFRVNSLSIIKREFNSLSKHASGKTKHLCNIKRTRGREIKPFFAHYPYKEIKPSSLDLSDVKVHRKSFDVSARGYHAQDKYRGRSGRMLEGNPLTHNLCYRHVENKDYLTTPPVPVINMDKMPSRERHFLSKFSKMYGSQPKRRRRKRKDSFFGSKGSKLMKEDPLQPFVDVNNEDELRKHVRTSRIHSGLLFNPARSRTERLYKLHRPHSFDSYTKRDSIQTKSKSSRLTYYNRKHVYPFKTKTYTTNMRKITDRNKNKTGYMSRSENFSYADSFEQSKKWFDVDLKFDDNPKVAIEMRKTTGRERHISGHCLRSHEEKTRKYLQGIHDVNPEKPRKRDRIPRLTVTGRDCGVRSIAHYVDSLVDFCDMNAAKYDRIRRNIHTKLENEGHGIRVKKKRRNGQRKLWKGTTNKKKKKKRRRGRKRKKIGSRGGNRLFHRK